MRLAFTMLELVLAMAMASMVGVGAFGVLNMMNRGDATLETRSVQVRELATLHGLLQTAMGSLVMSDAERPGNTIGGESVEQDPESVMAFDGLDDEQPVRPRMILQSDPSALAMIPGASHTPQSFEVVLRNGVALFNEPEGLSQSELAALQRGREAIRGVFELRPEGEAWALWWRPVDEHGGPIRADYESNREQSALRLCGGLNGFRWEAFYRGHRLPTYKATWSNDLPAYLEIEVSTTSGLYANWMFEVGWTTAAETEEVVEEDLGGDAEGGDAQGTNAGDAGGATAAGGAAGGDTASEGASDRRSNRGARPSRSGGDARSGGTAGGS